MSDLRIGHGYDVHRLVEERALILGGVEIPAIRGLLGHSDADVLLHAVSDAILGALGEADIGNQFPDNNPLYKGISSILILERVAQIMRARGASIVNVDSTLVMQAPKVASYIPNMRLNIAKALGCDISQVNVKATTEEHLGFTGREEGIAAHAVVLLEIKQKASRLL